MPLTDDPLRYQLKCKDSNKTSQSMEGSECIIESCFSTKGKAHTESKTPK